MATKKPRFSKTELKILEAVYALEVQGVIQPSNEDIAEYLNQHGDLNLGNPEEVEVVDLARTIVSLTGSRSEVVFIERPVDDPEIRCPDISRARAELGWEPSVPLAEGLQRTIDWAKAAWRA